MLTSVLSGVEVISTVPNEAALSCISCSCCSLFSLSCKHSWHSQHPFGMPAPGAFTLITAFKLPQSYSRDLGIAHITCCPTPAAVHA